MPSPPRNGRRRRPQKSVGEKIAGQALRRRAEKKARQAAGQTPKSVALLVHELRTHQIELEMQNEELRRAQSELEDSRARYFDLYDLAPVGYCTLSEKGLILEANLTAAKLFGADRGRLIKQPLTRFILPEDQDAYYRHRKGLFETGAPQACEMRMLRAQATPFWAHLELSAARAGDGSPLCRVAIIDITERRRLQESLRERVKELDCLYALSQLIEHSGKMAEVCRGVVTFICRGYSYPDIACARIVYQGQEFKTDNFRQTAWRQAAALRVCGKTLGRVEVCYLEKGAFLKEERALLDEAAKRLGRVAERLAALDELAEKREGLAVTLQSIGDGVIATDAGGHVVLINGAAKKMTGWTQAQAQGKLLHKAFKIINEKTGKVCEDLVEKVLEKGATVGLANNTAIIAKNGKRRSISSSAAPIRNSGGKITGVVLVFRDVTARRQTEAALRENEAKHKMLFEGAVDGIALADIETGIITDCNPALCRMVDREKAELVGQKQTILHPPQDAVNGMSPTFRIHKTEDPGQTVEDLFLTKGGKLLPVEIKAARVRIGDRECLIGIFRNITDRKRHEEEKRRLEERSRKVVEDVFRFIPEGVLVLSQKMDILRQNQAFRELVSGHAKRLGFTEDELGNLIMDKIKAGLRDNNLKEIRIPRKREIGK